MIKIFFRWRTYFKEKKHTLRFIEYMDVGNSNGWRMDEVVTKQEILDRIGAVMPLEADST